MPRIFFIICAIVLTVAQGASAVELPEAGAPDWLQRTMRPRWRLATLREAVADIQRVIELPVVAISQCRVSGTTTSGYSGRATATIVDSIELLEQTQGLHIRIEDLRLVIETPDEKQSRRRRMVTIPAGESMKMRLSDFNHQEQRFDGGDGFDLMTVSDGDDGLALDPDQALESSSR